MMQPLLSDSLPRLYSALPSLTPLRYLTPLLHPALSHLYSALPSLTPLRHLTPLFHPALSHLYSALPSFTSLRHLTLPPCPPPLPPAGRHPLRAVHRVAQPRA